MEDIRVIVEPNRPETFGIIGYKNNLPIFLCHDILTDSQMAMCMEREIVLATALQPCPIFDAHQPGALARAGKEVLIVDHIGLMETPKIKSIVEMEISGHINCNYTFADRKKKKKSKGKVVTEFLNPTDNTLCFKKGGNNRKVKKRKKRIKPRK